MQKKKLQVIRPKSSLIKSNTNVKNIVSNAE